MSMACSKVNGWSEIGFAFGMGPPLVVLAVRSLDHTSCWHALPLACSAFCYDISKDVRILAVIVAIAKLREIQRQIVFAHLVIGADHATLQEAPKAVQVRRMDVPAHIFPALMTHRFMREALVLEASIAGVFICGNQRHVFADCVSDEALQGLRAHLLNDLRYDVPFASNRPNHRNLVMWAMPARAALSSHGDMLVLKLSAYIRLVYFNLAHQLAETAVLHSCSDTMAHIPGRSIGSTPDNPLNLQGAHAFLAGQHEVDDLKPGLQGVIRVLEDGLGDDGKAVAVPASAILRLADPVKRAALDGKHLLIVATRAAHNAVFPSALLQELLTVRFSFEGVHQLGECLFHRLASLMLRPFYRFQNVVSSRL